MNFNKVSLIHTEGKSIWSTANESILETLERSDVAIESQCRDGFCGACRCKLITGEIEHFKDTIAFLAEDEFLPCSAIAKTDISIDIF